MTSSTRTWRRLAAALATPVAILAAAALVWQASYAAFSGETRNSGNSWSTGAVALTDDDGGSARFQAANMVPGATETKCIAVTVNASVPGVVKGYALNAQTSINGLENYVKISVRDGSGGGFGSCTGFTPSATLATDVSLAALATFNSFANGMGGWTVATGTHTRTYEITWTFDATGLTQNQLDQLQGDQTGIDFEWEMQSS
jgi:hypothetical protein